LVGRAKESSASLNATVTSLLRAALSDSTTSWEAFRADYRLANPAYRDQGVTHGPNLYTTRKTNHLVRLISEFTQNALDASHITIDPGSTNDDAMDVIVNRRDGSTTRIELKSLPPADDQPSASEHALAPNAEKSEGGRTRGAGGDPD
jgi:hypothetical protein